MVVNEKGHLEFAGCDVCELATLSPYPIYLLDEGKIRENMRRYSLSLQKHYVGNFSVFYACKAMANLAICKIAASEGFGLDVSSGGELYTALQAGFPMSKVIFHGNNKLEEELRLALEHQVSRIVIDNLDEARCLDKICSEMKRSCDVLIRVKVGIASPTHAYIETAGENSKFGHSIHDESALQTIQFVRNSPFIHFKGIHTHVGSQIQETDFFETIIGVISSFCEKLAKMGIVAEECNLGGGLGINYLLDHVSIPIENFIESICQKVQKEFKQRGLPLPHLMLEPGRSIVGDAGITIYQVGTIKKMQNGLIYASVNGGMNDNVRPALYQAKYRAVIANRMEEENTTQVSIVGKCCESGDFLIRDIHLPQPQTGDIVAVFSTGAYNYSMASNYNRLPIPGMLLLNQGKYEWVVRPQSYADLLQYDLIPSWL